MAQCPLSDEQVSFYHENGYLLVPGLLSAQEAAGYRAELHELAERLNGQTDATWATVRGDGPAPRTRLVHCPDVQWYLASVTRLLVDPRFTSIAQQLIGPHIQLHHTKMFIKPPEKGSPFPLHQDYPYFPHARHTMSAAIFHFDDAPLEKGCVQFIPGSHKLGPIPTDTPDHSLPADKYPLSKATPVPAKAGDMVFFNYLTIHGSDINRSSEARTTLLIQMRDPTDPPTLDTHRSRGQGMMLAGIDPSASS